MSEAFHLNVWFLPSSSFLHGFPKLFPLPIHLFPVCPRGQCAFHVLLDEILTPCFFLFLLQIETYLGTTETVDGGDHILLFFAHLRGSGSLIFLSFLSIQLSVEEYLG